jgi:pilus assembly protein FimV
VEQHTENQYDDDLTLGVEEHDDSYYTGAEDLFDFYPEDESPISGLKRLVLSIDWEITDEVLLMFNEELLVLRDIWADDKINQVYLQGLEKISKYIYRNKAESHPSAIKLLLTFYHNLEKIVSSEEWSIDQKMAIVLEDIKRFENLKAYIEKHERRGPAVEPVTTSRHWDDIDTEGAEELRALKAMLLGIDWEITDEAFNEIRREVVRLEIKYSDSKPRLILLKGIGTLGTYIKKKMAKAHSEAIKLLPLFYGSLDKIVRNSLSPEEERAVLLEAVEKFNSLKTMVGPTISSKARGEDRDGVASPSGDSDTMAPALSDVDGDKAEGFQAEQEARELGYDGSDDVVSKIADLFPEDVSTTSEFSLESNGDNGGQLYSVEKDVALQGVDVGEDDVEELEEPADFDDSPAYMSDGFVDSSFETESFLEKQDSRNRAELVGSTADVERERALQGVNVDDDDDDFFEESLTTEPAAEFSEKSDGEGGGFITEGVSLSPVPDEIPENQPVGDEETLLTDQPTFDDFDGKASDPLVEETHVHGQESLIEELEESADSGDSPAYMSDGLVDSIFEAESLLEQQDSKNHLELVGSTADVEREIALQGVNVDDDDDLSEESLTTEPAAELSENADGEDGGFVTEGESLSPVPDEIPENQPVGDEETHGDDLVEDPFAHSKDDSLPSELPADIDADFVEQDDVDLTTESNTDIAPESKDEPDQVLPDDTVALDIFADAFEVEEDLAEQDKLQRRESQALPEEVVGFEDPVEENFAEAENNDELLFEDNEETGSFADDLSLFDEDLQVDGQEETLAKESDNGDAAAMLLSEGGRENSADDSYDEEEDIAGSSPLLQRDTEVPVFATEPEKEAVLQGVDIEDEEKLLPENKPLLQDDGQPFPAFHSDSANEQSSKDKDVSSEREFVEADPSDVISENEVEKQEQTRDEEDDLLDSMTLFSDDDLVDDDFDIDIETEDDLLKAEQDQRSVRGKIPGVFSASAEEKLEIVDDIEQALSQSETSWEVEASNFLSKKISRDDLISAGALADLEERGQSQDEEKVEVIFELAEDQAPSGRAQGRGVATGTHGLTGMKNEEIIRELHKERYNFQQRWSAEILELTLLRMFSAVATSLEKSQDEGAATPDHLLHLLTETLAEAGSENDLPQEVMTADE